MENNKKPEAKPKSLNLKVKTLEKKAAPRQSACGGTPVIGYS